MNNTSKTIYYYLLLAISLSLFSQASATGLLMQNLVKTPCSEEQNSMYSKTYKKHIEELGLISSLTVVDATPCYKMSINGNGDSEKILLIKELGLMAVQNGLCPMVVMYNTRRKQYGVKLEEIQLENIDETCNSLFAKENEEQRNSRIVEYFNVLILAQLDNNLMLNWYNIYNMYLPVFIGLDNIFSFMVIQNIYVKFQGDNLFFQIYFMKQIVMAFVKYHEQYITKYISSFDKISDIQKKNEYIQSKVKNGGKYSSSSIWNTQIAMLSFLNLYNLQKLSETQDLSKIALACCSINAQKLLFFMKNFEKIIFIDSKARKLIQKVQMNESEDSYDVLLGEYKSANPVNIMYYFEERLIKEGILLVHQQGNFNKFASYMLHSQGACELNEQTRGLYLQQAKDNGMLPQDYDKDIEYCSQGGVTAPISYSVLYPVSFMGDSNHTHCEIVFEVNNEGNVSILTRTDVHYIYYLPCDNQHNSGRIYLV